MAERACIPGARNGDEQEVRPRIKTRFSAIPFGVTVMGDAAKDVLVQ